MEPAIGWQAVNPQARYTTIALDQMVVEDPARVGRMLRELMPLFASGELAPLRHEEFPLEDAAGAFRYMAQAKHIGKVVVTLSRGSCVARSPRDVLTSLAFAPTPAT